MTPDTSPEAVRELAERLRNTASLGVPDFTHSALMDEAAATLEKLLMERDSAVATVKSLTDALDLQVAPPSPEVIEWARQEAYDVLRRRVTELEAAAEPLVARLVAGDRVEGNPQSGSQFVEVAHLRALARAVKRR